MNFFTKIDIPESDCQIDYKSHLAFFGSCFADNISAQFESRKFKVLANPFGTVYNPLSLAKQIMAIADGKVFNEEDVFQDMRLGNGACLKNKVSKENNVGSENRASSENRVSNENGRDDNSAKENLNDSSEKNCAAPWHCWDAHSSLSAASREESIAKLNAATTQAREFLQKADVVFITLGTSFVYFLKDGNVVSNCHRQDPRMFIRKMISVDEAAKAIQAIVESLCKIKNDGSHIVFTVSPLRHMSDGAHSNTLSKATLQLAIEMVVKGTTAATTPATIEYFPSYEIVMDELRDYRFYDSDMVHLSKTAEEYIFERMTETYCDDKTRDDIKQVEKFLKMANHRIQNADSAATATFIQKLHAEAAKLESQIAGLRLNV